MFYPGHDSTADSKQRTDGENNQCQLPTVNEADNEAGKERRDVLEEEGELVADAVFNLIHVTARNNNVKCDQRNTK